MDFSSVAEMTLAGDVPSFPLVHKVTNNTVNAMRQEIKMHPMLIYSVHRFGDGLSMQLFISIKSIEIQSGANDV